MLVNPRPVDSHDEFVVVVLPDETEQHHGQRDVLRVHARLRGDVLDCDLQGEKIKHDLPGEVFYAVHSIAL